jgi:hypothetical protein
MFFSSPRLLILWFQTCGNHLPPSSPLANTLTKPRQTRGKDHFKNSRIRRKRPLSATGRAVLPKKPVRFRAEKLRRHQIRMDQIVKSMDELNRIAFAVGESAFMADGPGRISGVLPGQASSPATIRQTRKNQNSLENRKHCFRCGTDSRIKVGRRGPVAPQQGLRHPYRVPRMVDGARTRAIRRNKLRTGRENDHVLSKEELPKPITSHAKH